MDPTVVARQLLGARLSKVSEEGTVAVLITETEAYAGAEDPASHAFRGRTPRTEVMFGPAGRLYVYRSHGLHWCCNVTCGNGGEAAAVLIRAGRVVEGADLARTRRGPKPPEHKLASGPGNLAQALGITGEDNDTDLDGGSAIALTLSPELRQDQIRSGPRVGVTGAPDRPWRFWVLGDPTVTAYRRSPRGLRDRTPPGTPRSRSSE
jgi:DNA-3-methyladenine glycosylase